MDLRRLNDPSLLKTSALIAGDWLTTEREYPVKNPATGEVLASVARVDRLLTRRAIEGASRAFMSWRAVPAKQRARRLRDLFDLMREHREDLALILTLEQGKPLAEAKSEVSYAAGFIEWFSEQARRIDGDVLQPHAPGLRSLVLRQPVGVCAGITPWNFPCAMIARKLGAALASGCSMLLKPAEATPLSALALATLCVRAGFPPGVVSVLTGNREDAAEIGEELTDNRSVAKISFTGSTVVGKQLLARAAEGVQRVSMELGGNAPFIVFDDADLEAAIAGALAAKFRNCGQTCVSANRFLVQTGIHDAFVGGMRSAMAELKSGNGLEPGVQLGPLIDRRALDKVRAHVQDAQQRGATLLCGGRGTTEGPAFFEPTLFTGLTPEMLLWQQETFGPVAGVLRFDDEAEAIRLGNDTRSGLAAYFYTRDIARSFRVAEALEYGMVGTNSGMVSTEVAPFGGVKESGMGREGSRYGVDDYLQYKYVCIGGIGTP